MKKYYHTGKNNFLRIDKNPVVSCQTLESGTVVMWHDNTINSLIEDSNNAVILS